MRAIVLAGGTGSRLFPSTTAVSKQLLPVYDKPMVYYPLAVVFQAKIKDILIITTPNDRASFLRLLGNGSQWGVNINYEVQEKPDGIAQAFLIAENFIGKEDVMLILGDNLFYGESLAQRIKSTKTEIKSTSFATIFSYQVENPNRYGVVEFDKSNHVISLEEKPKYPKSNYAITGLYFYPNDVIKKSKILKPSSRGELEITDLNNLFLSERRLKVEPLPKEFLWLDTGTHESLLEATQIIHAIEKRQGIKIGCLEEIALNNQWISPQQLLNWTSGFSNSSYGAYLLNKYQNIL